MNTGTNYASEYNGSLPAITSELQRQPQVSAACVSLEHALEAAHKICAELEARLQPLLRNEPEATGTSDNKEPTMVPLASQINGYVRQLQVLSVSYQSILRRLEL